MNHQTTRLIYAAIGSILAGGAHAEMAPTTEPALLDRVIVTASRKEAGAVAGSVHFLDASILEQHAYGDINRILRQVPGLNIVEEEGFGIRPNIGIRGSGTDRNSKIAVLEDGVPIAPAPYSAPSAYYFPRLQRMSAIEVSKGPAAIKYGPQTVAGAIGLFSSAIPGASGIGLNGKADLIGGAYGSLRGHALAGGWTDAGVHDLGWSLETLQEKSDGFKRLDSGGDTGYRIQDYVAKLALRSTAEAAIAQSLELKFQHSEEDSDETYLGLTLDDFRGDPYRRYRASQLDNMDVTHETLQATHRIDFSEHIDLTTIVYRTDTARAWYKLNDVRNAANTAFVSLSSVLADPAAFPVEYAALIGTPGTTSAAGALRMRNNDREYYAEGIQSVLGMTFETGGAAHELEFSVRYHQDGEDRFQQDDRYQMMDGAMVLTTAGAPGTQDNRVGSAEAWAFFIRDTITAGDWVLTPGLRYESISLTQRNWGTADPARSTSPAMIRNNVDATMPGLGVTRAIGESLRLIAGLHRGFVNPAPGSSADPEQSWNYEAGLRFERGDAALEAMGFLVEYDNLVGTCTASTGGGCNIGDQYDGGRARVHGLELVASHDLGRLLGLSLSLPVSAVYTWTQGEFRTSFQSGFAEWANVAAGDELPYAPEHQLTLNAGLEGRSWRVFLTVNYVGEARAIAGSGPIPVAQRIESRTLVDLSGEYDVSKALSLFAAIENLGDEVYNVALRPAGARPGAPLTLLAGVKMRF
ncbi:MAG: TonB-dependent receptor [Steroidobacteraceae bacterium]|nr:TonB-dependent receptor [Steroidobacteraceae bacterium]MBM2853334.1 TonB-dependent receptor [Steroidobacteraceae bacterium]